MTAAPPVAETDRLALRQFTPADAPFILRLLNEPSFLENIGDKGIRTAQQAARYLVDGPIRSYARHGHGLYLVALEDSQEPIGMCGILQREGMADVDLGYAFLPEHWSNGYAFESASAVLRAEGSRFPRILAFVSPGNAPSIRLLERLGFGFAGHTKLTADAPDVSVYARPPGAIAPPPPAR
jgi:ribosomal-protein-alanine N-acetyltransferase